ncbi:a3938c3d-7df9-4018-8993-d9c3dc00e44b [Sclerotinia trifoliorum]|uniref:A3938c3d-7df9-4018-8993-d9c3dc00e44b n=1 Tax=Sclerotinia trifoliorum TaxID=28548 RepID=A0A8H2ZRA7_9HELO|nr:a3938c3d-7df9-4018-8993-d9c3dc00e44b [Sclerotinia trifoliorum]
MVNSSGSNIIVDPDGDLILLINQTKPKSTSCLSIPGAGAIAAATNDDSGSTDSEMTRSLEFETSEDDSTLVYNDRILVSSKHMSLASPVFKAMLQGGFREGIELKTTGKVEVPLPDDDPAAMRILINIIHGRMNSVPLNIDLELFTQMAILADKYQCTEVVRPFPSIWTNGLTTGWTTSSTSIACWLCIAWHFELDSEFLRATQLIQGEGTCSLEETISARESNLPIPELVVDKLESYRIEGIGKAVQVLKDTIYKYQQPVLQCTSRMLPGSCDRYGSQHSPMEYTNVNTYRNGCDSMVLGTLIKSAIANNLYPLTEPPYTSWSLQSFTAKAQLLEASTLCGKVANIYVPPHTINVIDQLKKSIHSIVKPPLTLAVCKELVKKT